MSKRMEIIEEVVVIVLCDKEQQVGQLGAGGGSVLSFGKRNKSFSYIR